MLPLQLDANLLTLRGAAEKGIALVPVLLALATGVIALLQVVNGLPTETVIETLIFGWLLATPVAALLLWPLPASIPVPSLSATNEESEATDDPVQVLRDRYAAGEIDEAEFERRLEHLLATEDQHAGHGTTSEPPDHSDRGSAAVAEPE